MQFSTFLDAGAVSRQQIDLICFTMELFMNPRCILNPRKILQICYMLDLELPILHRQVKDILSMIDTFEQSQKIIKKAL